MKEFGIKNVIVGFFVFAAFAGFLVFAGIIKLDNQEQAAQGNVVVWGTIPFSVMQPYIEQSKEQNLKITYVEKDDATYENELVNALASNSGPDLFVMPHENLLRHVDKLFEIPYASFPKPSYEQTYICLLYTSDAADD